MNTIGEFWARKVNVLELGEGIMLGRESTGAMDYMTISRGEEVLYGWWHNPERKIRKGVPKHTGGKKPYIKIMVEEIQKHTEISLSAAGFLIKLAGNINWSDNKLINKRSKKPLNAEGIQKILGIGKSRVYEIISELKKDNVLIDCGDEYRISTCLIQKGGAVGERTNEKRIN